MSKLAHSNTETMELIELNNLLEAGTISEQELADIPLEIRTDDKELAQCYSLTAAKFNSLSRVERAKLRLEQRASWLRGEKELGLDGSVRRKAASFGSFTPRMAPTSFESGLDLKVALMVGFALACILCGLVQFLTHRYSQTSELPISTPNTTSSEIGR